MTRYKILAVEDEVTTQILLQRSLSPSHDLIVVGSLERAKEALKNFKPDLVLLDLYLPDGNGFDFFDYLKGDAVTHRIPVIFLSLESDTQTKVKSFSAGAYDYITKPFDQVELVARIDAHYARSLELNSALYTPEKIGDLVLNRESKQVFHQNSDGQKEELGLSPTEYRLFEYFVTHFGKALSREQIAKEVWNRVHFQSRTIDRHVSSLRKKIASSNVTLKTVSHGGYLLDLPREDVI